MDSRDGDDGAYRRFSRRCGHGSLLMFSVARYAVLLLLLTTLGSAEETKTLFLSGLGKDDPVQ